MSEVEGEYDWSFLWTTEKDKWFLVYYPNSSHYAIKSIDREQILMKGKGPHKEFYDFVTTNMLENGVKVISYDEYINMLPPIKITFEQRLDNMFYRFVQPIMLKIIRLFYKI